MSTQQGLFSTTRFPSDNSGDTDMGDLEYIEGKVVAGDYFHVTGAINDLNDTIEHIVADGKTAFMIEARITLNGTAGLAANGFGTTNTTQGQILADFKIDGTTESKTGVGGVSNAWGGNGTGSSGSSARDLNPNGNFNVLGLSLVGGVATQATGTVTCVSAIATNTVTVNGLLYTGVNGVKSNNTEFSVDTGDNATATDLADSITNDTRTGTDEPTVDQTAIAATNVVTITASFGPLGNNVGLSSSDGGTLAVSGATLTGGAGKIISIQNVSDAGTGYAEMSGYLRDT